jgi:cytosine/adenosine deaminase-related metal-dependent hydrolase
MKELLLSADTILPVSSKPFKKASILIAGGKIREVGKSSSLRRRHTGVNEIDFGHGILLPGFVNAHTHLELGWMRTRLQSFRGFTGWLKQIVREKRSGVSNREIIDSVEDGVETLIGCGVTTVGEISSFGGMDKPHLKASGLRTVLFREVLDSNEDGTDFSTLEDSPLFQERLFPHSLYSCSPGLLKKTLRSYRKRGVPIGIHLGESADEVDFVKGEENDIEKKIFPLINKASFKRPSADSPVTYLKRAGLLDGTKITLVHMVQVSEEEASELSHTDTAIVLCPRSNLFLQVGAPRLSQYLDFRRVGIGTDGLSSNYNLDFFEEMRFFHLLISVAAGSKAAFKTVYAATLGGAHALFIEKRTGSIEPGKEADLIFLSTGNDPRDPYLSVISSTPGDVRMVMVGGRIIYAGPKFLSQT